MDNADRRKLWLVTATIEREVEAYVLAETEEEARKGYTFDDVQREDCIDMHDMTTRAVPAYMGEGRRFADGWERNCVIYGDNPKEITLGGWLDRESGTARDAELRRLEAIEDAKTIDLFEPKP